MNQQLAVMFMMVKKLDGETEKGKDSEQTGRCGGLNLLFSGWLHEKHYSV